LQFENSKLGIESSIQVKPFLRWAGGKSRLTKYLKEYLPKEFGRYWEPFLGSGALYFCLFPTNAYLSDSNSDLISCFRYVRDYPQRISSYLFEHAERNSEEYYYYIRDIYNRSAQSVAQAARFIYLNKTSFNGIFRVNMNGAYNVPYGQKDSPSLPTLSELVLISNRLKFAELEPHSYEALVNNQSIQSKDFIYLDPPYPPLNGTSNFTHYTAKRFSWEDQERVADVANSLSQKGCFVMVSNSDVPRIRELYKGWNISVLPVVRWIAANGVRHKVNELVITNYLLQESN